MLELRIPEYWLLWPAAHAVCLHVFSLPPPPHPLVLLFLTPRMSTFHVLHESWCHCLNYHNLCYKCSDIPSCHCLSRATTQSLHNVAFIGESSKVAKINLWLTLWFTCNSDTRKSFAQHSQQVSFLMRRKSHSESISAGSVISWGALALSLLPVIFCENAKKEKQAPQLLLNFYRLYYETNLPLFWWQSLNKTMWDSGLID